MNVPFERANAISDMMPDWANLETMLWSENCPDELKNIVQNDAQIQDVINFASRLEWNIRQIWVHACWMIISPEDVNFYTAVQFPLKTTATVNPLVTQLDGKNLEKIWLLKMDFLWLRNLSIIKNCIKIIAAQHKKENKKFLWKYILPVR
jgi:DNA polymerase III alpha subunit